MRHSTRSRATSATLPEVLACWAAEGTGSQCAAAEWRRVSRGAMSILSLARSAATIPREALQLVWSSAWDACRCYHSSHAKPDQHLSVPRGVARRRRPPPRRRPAPPPAAAAGAPTRPVGCRTGCWRTGRVRPPPRPPPQPPHSAQAPRGLQWQCHHVMMQVQLVQSRSPEIAE
jgi:hypothetical protein